MKKILTCLVMVLALQTVAFADAETDMHQHYIQKIQAQNIKYSTMSYFNAIANGNINLCDMFIKSGMSPKATFMKVPAIYMAISSNQNEVVKLLLDNGVDANAEISGLSPLIVAIKNKDAKIVETLISYGADVNKEVGYTKPLQYAVEKNQPVIVEQLISAGAKPDNEVLLKALKSDNSYIKDCVLKTYKKMK